MTADESPVAVVSGGSRGLGLEIVAHLLRGGWRVATTSRQTSPALTELIAAHPESCHWSPGDLSADDTARLFTREVLDAFGRVDLLVNNVGVLRQELLVTLPRTHIDSLIDVNLRAPILLTQACARAMAKGGGGRIINISSINAIRGFRGVSVYAAAKAGLDGLTRSLARELGPLDILVNSIVPGYFDSTMTEGVTAENRTRIARRTPLNRLGTIAEIVSVVDFMASPASSFITGQTIVVDGGITC